MQQGDNKRFFHFPAYKDRKEISDIHVRVLPGPQQNTVAFIATTLLLIMSTDACIMHTTHACVWIYFVLLNFTTEAVVWPIRWSDRPRVNLETGLVFSACDV